MASEKGARGVVATLLFEARKKTELNQSQLAERAGISRSSIVAAESGQSLPTLELCLKVARVLGIPVAVMFRAHAQDYIGEVDPAALAELGMELWGGNAHWETIAEQHGLRIDLGRSFGVVNEDGDMKLRRQYSRCRATRPRRSIVFTNRVVGEKAPDFAVKGLPKGLGYTVHVEISGEWAVHRVEFARPWTAQDGPFDFEFETTLPRAYVVDLEEWNRRRMAEGMPARRHGHGDFRLIVHHAFEQFELGIALPPSWPLKWNEPTATWGSASIEIDEEDHRIHERTCRSVRFEAKEHEARLTLDKPVPGYTFGIQWTPVAGSDSGRGDAK
jgi:putative transcriptional regulator